MKNVKLYTGFNPDFLQNDKTKQKVSFPVLGESYKNDIAPVSGNKESVVNYLNYSLQLSRSRKFPIFTASNIDGRLFQKASRSPSWKIDDRVKNYQWGHELYRAEKSDFDKGHMTKREDVQWSDTVALAQMAVDSTFFYSNAVPQHKELNQEIWKSLEDYILHTETRKNSLKVCVFTGPVLSKNDPMFVTQVEGEEIKLPVIFWKVVVFPKKDGKLYRVGFLMSQRKLLSDDGIVKTLKRTAFADDIFNQFEDAGTYQVNLSLIEQLTDMKFPEAIDSYTDTRSTKLVLEEIEIAPDSRLLSSEQKLGFRIGNLKL
jgi:endonuclease G, mitochondrial